MGGLRKIGKGWAKIETMSRPRTLIAGTLKAGLCAGAPKFSPPYASRPAQMHAKRAFRPPGISLEHSDSFRVYLIMRSIALHSVGPAVNSSALRPFPVQHSSSLRHSQRMALILAILCLALCGADAQAQSLQATRASLSDSTSGAAYAVRRIAQPTSADLPGGSRVTIVSDAPLSDYQAYASGESFYVRLPHAEGGMVGDAGGALRGRGFDYASMEKSGDGLLFSFHLQPGTSARVSQKFNRLYVIFTVAESAPQAEQVSSLSAATTDALQ